MLLMDTYTKEAFEKLIPEVDTATADNLYDYFADRTPIDNFERYIHITTLEYIQQYNMMLRDESVSYDAMVTDYIERLTKSKTNGQETAHGETKDGKKTNTTLTGTGEDKTVVDSTGNTTETPNTTVTENTNSDTNGSRKNTGTQETNGTDGGTTTADGVGNSMGMGKTNPNQVAYSASAGVLPALNWASADSQQQSKTDENRSETRSNHNDSTRTDNLTETTTDHGEGKTTTSTTGTNKTDTTGKQTTTYTRGAGNKTEGTEDSTGTSDSQNSSNSESRTTDRYAGRHGYSPAELLEKSRNYILLMKSFKWLCDKYNHCFLWEVEF